MAFNHYDIDEKSFWDPGTGFLMMEEMEGSKNNNQLGAAAMERERELRILAELRGGDEESKILGQPGRGGGEFGDGGDGLCMRMRSRVGGQNREAVGSTEATDARG